MRRNFLACLLLAVLTFAVYWPARHYDFIQYDDPQFVTENRHVKEGLTWNGVKWAFSSVVVANWHPITNLSHILDCQLFGVAAGAHHMVNVVIHALNSVLLFFLFVRLSVGFWKSTLGAAIFALHPLHVESVAWISERKDLLAALFFLLTLLAYVQYIENIRQSAKRRIWWGLSLFLFLLGLMSKPMLVTLPFIMVILDYWPFARIDQKSNSDFFQSILRSIKEKWGYFLLSAGFCVLTFWLQARAGATKMIHQITLQDKIENVVVSYLKYLGKFVWPTRLAIIYPHSGNHYPVSDMWPRWQIVLGSVSLLLITVLALSILRKKPYFAVGWLWFIGMLIPVIGLIQVGEQAMADRYMYLPMIGIIIALIYLADDLTCKMGASLRQTGRVMMIVGTAVLGLQSSHQVRFWRNSHTLFEHASEVTPDNPMAHFVLGLDYAAEQEIGKAMVQYRTCIAIDLSYEKARSNFAILLIRKGFLREAAQQFSVIVSINPANSIAHINLASISGRFGQKGEEILHLNAAIRIDPNAVEALNNLAWILATDPNPQFRNGKRAVDLAMRACKLTGFQQTVTVGTLAASLAEAGQFDAAVSEATRACALAAAHADEALLRKNTELLYLYKAGLPDREDASVINR
jgi:Tfp pilus assembly protein PilF